MCALWTQQNLPDDPSILKYFLPRNLSTSSTPPTFSHLIQAFQVPIEGPRIHVQGLTPADHHPNLTYTRKGQHLSPLTERNNNFILEIPTTIESNALDEADRPDSVTINFTHSSPIDTPADYFFVDPISNHNQSFYHETSTLGSPQCNSPPPENKTLLTIPIPDEQNKELTQPSPLYKENELKVYSNKPRRSHSFKTSKSPPDTPTTVQMKTKAKKMVRFADAFGLELERIRHIAGNKMIDFDFPSPTVVALESVMKTNNQQLKSKAFTYFTPNFPQPGTSDTFLQSVLEKKVYLESIVIEKNTLTGIVRVRSITIEKNVFIRVTFNQWGTFSDIHCSYVKDSHDGQTDKFSFSIVLPKSLPLGDKVVFAICYVIDLNTSYWDNNNGKNYTIECFTQITSSQNNDMWMHFL